MKIKYIKYKVISDTLIEAIGVDANFIKFVKVKSELTRNKSLGQLQQKYKFDVTKTKSFKKEAIKQTEKVRYTCSK